MYRTRIRILVAVFLFFASSYVISQTHPIAKKAAQLSCPDIPGDGVLPPNGESPAVALKVGFVGTSKGRPQAVIYSEHEGYAVFQGDIILGKIDEVEAKKRRQGEYGPESVVISDPNLRWPNATVPYEIDTSLPNQGRIVAAIASWQQSTGVQIAPHQGEPDYVYFTTGTGCYSSVGRQGGKQTILLSDACDTANVIHELGHTLGLLHEHTRLDRDQFISVTWSNIPVGWQNQFQEVDPASTQNIGVYDYCSIMHYPQIAGGYNNQGQPVFDYVNQCPACIPGKGENPSDGDIRAIKTMYGLPLTLQNKKKPSPR